MAAKFTLFLHPKSQASRKLHKLVDEYMSRLSIKLIDGSQGYPPYINGVPSIADNSKKLVFQGSDAFKAVTELIRQVKNSAQVESMQKPAKKGYTNMRVGKAIGTFKLKEGISQTVVTDRTINDDDIQAIMARRNSLLKQTQSPDIVS
tara:strand:- start:55 stop:498 length:444 start_codon:yes stop_codon:yes gene_type:complete